MGCCLHERRRTTLTAPYREAGGWTPGRKVAKENVAYRVESNQGHAVNDLSGIKRQQTVHMVTVVPERPGDGPPNLRPGHEPGARPRRRAVNAAAPTRAADHAAWSVHVRAPGTR